MLRKLMCTGEGGHRASGRAQVGTFCADSGSEEAKLGAGPRGQLPQAKASAGGSAA